MFLNRSLPYALQQRDGAYHWIYQRCRTRVVQAHLDGGCTVAVSSADEAGWCRWICLDSDAPDGLPQLVRLAESLSYWGFPGLLEASRRGGHLWLLLDDPAPASLARHAIKGALERLAGEGVPVPQVEVYPNVDSAEQLGHAVRLPLGIHQKTVVRYPLLSAQGKALVFRSTEAALSHCLEMSRIPSQWLRQGWASPLPPRAVGDGVAFAGTISPVIRWVDAEVSPLDLLAEYVPASQMRKAGKGYLGWCPFHDDRAQQEDGSAGTPSFYIVQDARYGWSWRCLSTNCRFNAGLMKHSFLLFQALLGVDAGIALQLATVKWPEREEAS